MQTIKPSANHLFCKPDDAVTQTRSGLLLSTGAEKPHTAEVINVGSAVREYKSRDKIVYKPYATTEIKLDGQEFFLINEEDVLGSVLENDG